MSEEQEESVEQDDTESKIEELLDQLAQAKRKQADVLVEIAKRGKLFHAPDGVAYADVQHKGHRETWPVRAAGYRKHLLHIYYQENKNVPNKDAISNALAVIESEAAYEGKEHPVAIRVGGHGDAVYLDLCNDAWQVIEIDADGWRIIDESPIRFIRTAGMLPLPMPVAHGKTKDWVNKLADYINVAPGADFALVKAWVLAAFHPQGPYPVLALIGQHGGAKSTTLRILRSLLDPNSGDLKAPPRTADDLYITASRSHIVPLDNIGSLQDWLSDALCRIATGIAYCKRQLFTDQDEILIRVIRPIALTSVVECINAPDLGDRAIIVAPPRIEDRSRREEKKIYKDFESDHPAILAAFLFVVSHGLRMMPDIVHQQWPRMADFAKWATACEGAHDAAGTFAAAYSDNRMSAVTTLLGENIVGSAILQIGETLTRSKEWPKSTNKLGADLRRLIVFLREAGVEVEPPPRKDKSRTWHFWAKFSQNETSPGTSPDCNQLNLNGLGEVGEVGHVLRGMTVSTPVFNQQDTQDPKTANHCKTSPTSPKKSENGEIPSKGNGLGLGEVPGEVLGEVPTSPKAPPLRPTTTLSAVQTPRRRPAV